MGFLWFLQVNLDFIKVYLKYKINKDKTFLVITWSKIVARAGAENVDLQERFQGNFHDKGSQYACYGASLAVVELDCLTGEVNYYFEKKFQKINK